MHATVMQLEIFLSYKLPRICFYYGDVTKDWQLA